MRPDKPGYWWYKLNSTTHAVVYIRHCLAGGLMAEDRGRVVPLVEFEEGVDEWIGPAHPPKKVKSFECLHGRTTYCDTRKAVLLDDVKEYLLEEQ
jgi:hypothetical protein